MGPKKASRKSHSVGDMSESSSINSPFPAASLNESQSLSAADLNEFMQKLIKETKEFQKEVLDRLPNVQVRNITASSMSSADIQYNFCTPRNTYEAHEMSFNSVEVGNELSERFRAYINSMIRNYSEDKLDERTYVQPQVQALFEDLLREFHYPVVVNREREFLFSRETLEGPALIRGTTDHVIMMDSHELVPLIVECKQLGDTETKNSIAQARVEMEYELSMILTQAFFNPKIYVGLVISADEVCMVVRLRRPHSIQSWFYISSGQIFTKEDTASPQGSLSTTGYSVNEDNFRKAVTMIQFAIQVANAIMRAINRPGAVLLTSLATIDEYEGGNDKYSNKDDKNDDTGNEKGQEPLTALPKSTPESSSSSAKQTTAPQKGHKGRKRSALSEPSVNIAPLTVANVCRQPTIYRRII